MRRIGTLKDREEAERFGDYLLTQQIKTQIDAAGGEWAVWVFDEDRLDEAKQQLDAFRANPQAEQYRQAIVEADQIRHADVRQQAQAKKNTVDMADRWRRPMIAQIPLTFTLIVLSVAVTIGTRFGRKLGTFGGALTIIETRSYGDDAFIAVDPQTGGDRLRDLGLVEIRSGQIWRLVTPIFLHLDPLHLLFNMYWTVAFGAMIETRQNSWSLLVVVLVTAVISNLCQYYFKSFGFGGMSGVIFGMFGYLWILGRVNPRSDVQLPPNLIFLFIAWMLICMTGAVGSVANYAHAFGLLSGMVLGAARGWWQVMRRT